MTNLNVNDYGVTAIEMQEAKEVNGGGILYGMKMFGGPCSIFAYAADAIYGAYRAGYDAGYNG